MSKPNELSQRQMDMLAAFVRYVVDHPEVDDLLPESSQIFFEIEGEEEFNRYSWQSAHGKYQEDGVPLVRVRAKGLQSSQEPQLIDPVIERVSSSAVA